MRLKTKHVWLGLPFMVAIVVTSAAAIQIFMSKNFCDVHDYHYAVNETVTVCGEWDEYDFPCPIGDIYISANDGHTYGVGEQLHDSMGGENAVQGCGGSGAFFDAIIALPALSLGAYDVVMDENQDGYFSGGEHPDYVLGNGAAAAFEVIDVTLADDVDVEGIKSQAFENALTWSLSGFALDKALTWGIGKLEISPGTLSGGYATADDPGRDALFSTVRGRLLRSNIAHAWIVHYLQDPPSPPEFDCTASALDQYKNYLLYGVYLIKMAAFSQVEVNYDLYNDPEDPAYAETVSLGPVNYAEAGGPGYLHRLHLSFSDALNEQASLGVALREAIEKFKGAAAATDNYWAKIQNESIYEYACLMKTSVDSTVSINSEIKAWIEGLGLGDAYHEGDMLAALQARVDSSGFTPEELEQMDAVGMTEAEIESLRAAVLEPDPYAFDGVTVSATFDSLGGRLEHSAGALAGLISDCEYVRERLANVWIDHPTAVIDVPESAPEGSAVVFSGASSTDPRDEDLSYAWDFDADGDFDDAYGVEVTNTWWRERTIIVGLEITNQSGLKDVAYARLRITVVEDGPMVTFAYPESTFIEVDGADDIVFELAAEDTSSEDPITYTWYVNGAPAGATGPTFVWTPLPDVSVIWADITTGSPLSLDNRWVWRVRVKGPVAVEPRTPGLPGRVAFLRQNRPNPFSKTTTITLELTAPSHVRMTILDVSGRLVTVLADETLKAGPHEFAWDGRDAQGRRVAAGVYCCSVEAGSYTQTRRMTFVR
jgi:hypothetical protein